jgi:starch phosphorylase
VFVPNYDAHIGRLMTQGCDVWLNNPRRPREASGTSGQKASLNGNLNLSILDGWWPEGYDGDNGWAIGDTREWTDQEEQDAFDVETLYSLLEKEILPTFEVPTKWAKKMAHTITTCGPVFNTHRMVRQYLNEMYKS